MDRPHSTKLRARRIEMDYFARRAPLRTARVVLSVAAFALAGAWVASTVLAGRRRAFQPGPVSAAHALVGARCTTCHDATVEAVAAAPRWAGATDAACQRCHHMPDHQTNATSTPPCGRCHAEHRGTARLAAVGTAACVACHGTLAEHARDTPRLVQVDARKIRGFAAADGHPEFAVATSTGRRRLNATPPPEDATPLALNHRLHLEPGLRGPAGPVQLRCRDCHEGSAEDAAASPTGSPTMAPVTFARHCAACHPNTFDARFGALAVPHDTPAVIHAFLRGLYTEHVATHPDALADPRRRLLGRDETVRAPETWAVEQTAQAEELLFRDPKRCAACHTLAWEPDATLPEVAPTRLPRRWLAHGAFDHRAHRLVACGECHAAATSERSTDVLLPTADTCRSCHHAGGAPDRCSVCHVYHRAPGWPEIEHGQRIRELAAGPRLDAR